MKAPRKVITRRDFIRGTAGVTLAGAAAASQDGGQSPAGEKSKVVLVRDSSAVDGNGEPNGEVLNRMLDEAVTALLGTPDAGAAWKKMIKPADVVGIKTNVWRFLHTPEALEEGLKKHVMDAGVPESRVAADDRGVLRNEVFQNATALINIRPMRTHHWSGVGTLLKNYIVFHEKPYTWHDDACANLAGLWELPPVKGKTRLNVLVMLTPLFQGKGPHHFQKKYTWPYKGLLVGFDPVAVDATGLRILEAKRREYFGDDLPFAVPPKHIQVAQDKFKLGNADAGRIELVKLGWKDDVLI